MSANRNAALIFLAALIYAVVRYVVFHGVAWSNVPLYIVNKALSWAALVYFGASVTTRAKERRRYYGNLAAATVLAHVILSLMVLDPAYFGKFYDASGRFNAVGEVSMLAGVLGSVLMAGLVVANVQGHSNSGRSLRRGWGRAILWLAGIHVLVMGFAGWWRPGDWPGYLPPISLLSFLTALGYLACRTGQSRADRPRD
jgi:hypothetical protein